MSLCFLFVDQLDENEWLSLRLAQDGQVEAPLDKRSTEAFIKLQKDAKTWVVLPTTRCTLHQVELPWLPERKARAAIPYALEEELAQNVSLLHFAFDKHYYQNHRYLVAVIEKNYISNLIEKLNQLNIEFHLLTLDWFALNDKERCLTPSYLLVNDEQFKGALSGDFIDDYLSSTPYNVFTFADSRNAPTNALTEFFDASVFTWLAERLQKMHPIDLSQGDFQQTHSNRAVTAWYAAAAGLAGVFLLSVICISLVNLYFLNKKTVAVDAQIADIYKTFFPEARQVISPRFRIEQLLKTGTGKEKNAFWIALSKLAQVSHEESFTVEQLRFQNQTLSITLSIQDFKALERLQQRLQKTKLKVVQNQASTQDGQVFAILELSQ